jgi:hypothetical protein
MTFNPLSWLETEAPIVEADVQKFVAAIINDVEVAIADLEKGLAWLASETPAIAQGVAQLATFAESVAPAAGPTGMAVVTAAVTTANVAMAGLTAFANSYNQATTTGITATKAAQALVNGYQALTAAKAAVNSGAATAASVAPATS